MRRPGPPSRSLLTNSDLRITRVTSFSFHYGFYTTRHFSALSSAHLEQHDRVDGSAARSTVHQEFRDDRMCVFFSALTAGQHEIIYYLRAETPGRCTMATGCAYPMYDEKTRGETGASKIEVKGP